MMIVDEVQAAAWVTSREDWSKMNNDFYTVGVFIRKTYSEKYPLPGSSGDHFCSHNTTTQSYEDDYY